MEKLLAIVVTVFLIAHTYITIPVQYVTYQLELPYIEPSQFRLWDIKYPIAKDEMDCLILNTYHEARGEIPDGQFATADVVMHRVNHYNYPNTICGVVKAGIYPPWSTKMPLKYKCHFSWFCDRRPDDVTDHQGYLSAKYVAETVLNDSKYIPRIDYGLFYHTKTVSPYWAEDKEIVAYLGNHLFY